MSDTNIITNTDVYKIVANASSSYVDTVKQFKWALIPDSQLQAAKKALTKNNYIMKVAAGDPGAVYDAILQAAILGFDLTEGKKQGWLLPRKNQFGKVVIVLQPGYKGVEAVHQRTGSIKRCEIRTVYRNDTFSWSGYASDIPAHTWDWGATEEARGAPSHAFITSFFPDGEKQTVLSSVHDIYRKHRDKSESYKAYKKKNEQGSFTPDPPWVEYEKEMIEKTMIYIAAKQWPSYDANNETNSRILETLHEVDVSDYSQDYSQKQREVFHGMLEARDGLGLELFDTHVGIEVASRLWLDVRSNIPRGRKDKEMGELQKELGDGSKMLFNIKDAIANEDALSLYENMEGCTEYTEPLLLKVLDPEERKVYENLKQEIPEGD